MKQRHIFRRMSGSLLAFLLASTLILMPFQGNVLLCSNTLAYADEGAPLTALQLQQAIEEAQQAYTEARENADEAAEKVAEQEERIKEIETELLPAQQERTGAATREMYKVQQNGFNILGVLLGAESLGDFINQLEYVTRVTDKHHAEMMRLTELKQELEDSRAELRTAQEEADKLVDETYAALEAAQEAQAESLRRLEEEAQREAALAASGGHLVEGDRTNDIVGPSAPAVNNPPEPETNTPEENSGNSGDSGNSSNNNTPSGESEFTPPPASSDSLEGWAARIDAYLAGSPLAGQGYTFASAALNYGVDPRFSPAIACTESGKGRYCFLPHNAWGWGSVSWDSWEEAIDAHVRGLASLYGYTVTVEGAQMYCPPNWRHWYQMVSSQMALI